MPPAVRQRGLLYDQAAQYARALEAGDEAAALTMLNAWSDGYWGVRRELDGFLAKVAAARAAGEKASPAWAFQQRRLQQVLDEASRQMARYSQAAALVTEQRQRQAIQQGLEHAEGLAATVIQEGLPGLEGTLARVNPAVLEAGVGFMADGSVLRNHLAKTLPDSTVQRIRDTLVHGLAAGKSQDWMTRQVTRGLGITHGRAVTILRTESLRAYRTASRDTYMANADVMGGWVWNAHLDARTCVACVLMDGTEHPLDATLDGHPRCRCAMIPRTRSWEDILGPDGADIPDTRPPVRSGKAWLEAQPPTTQRAIIGRAKFTAWQEGHITLDDMVARTSHPDWGTMRTERSLKAITEGRDANWIDQDLVDHPKPASLPEPVAPVRPAFPEGKVPRSKFPQDEMKRTWDRLPDLDDAAVRQNATGQKDAGARWLFRQEWKFRQSLKPPAPPATLPDRLPRVAAVQDLEALTDPWRAERDAVQAGRWGDGEEYQVNCTNVTTAWELRRRGYDVTAAPRPTLRGRPRHETAEAWGADPDEWMEELTPTQALAAMKRHGEGARGAISVTWNAGGGHIFNWEVRGGKVVWSDAQPPPSWGSSEGDDLLDLLKRRVTGKVQVFRMDNLPITDALADYLREG